MIDTVVGSYRIAEKVSVGEVTLDDTNSAAMAPPFQFDKTNIEEFSKIY